MTAKTLGAWGAGCGTELLLRTAAAAVLLGGFCACTVVASVVPLPAGVQREQVAAFALVIGVFGVVVLALAGAAGLLIWRARQLDAAFLPLGLRGGLLSLAGRQYHGPLNGRAVDAYYTRGPTLDLYLGTSLRTHFTVAKRDRLGQALAGLVNRTPLALDDAQLADLAIYADDPAWALARLNDARVRDWLLRLTDDTEAGAGRFEIRSLLLQPEALMLRLQHVRSGNLTEERVRGWLGAMESLLRALEAAPAPTVRTAATSTERMLRLNRGGLTARVLLVLFAVLGVLLVCFFVFGLLSVVAGGS